jgi:hypothetical protein
LIFDFCLSLFYRLWLIVADVLTATLQFDPALLRGYIFARINDTDRDGINSSGVLSSVVMIVTTRDPEVCPTFPLCIHVVIHNFFFSKMFRSTRV